MGNENLNSDEDYLDRLLRSVSGDNSDDNEIDTELDSGDFDAEEDFDFDEEINSLEKSLDIDKEKDFDISEIFSENEMPDNTVFTDITPESTPENIVSTDTTAESTLESAVVTDIEDESTSDNAALTDDTQEENISLEEDTIDVLSDEMDTSVSDTFEEIEEPAPDINEESIAPELDEDLMASIDNMMNPSDESEGEKESVDEAISVNDSLSPEDDIQGLMNILSSGNEEIDEAVDEKPKKKKKKFSLFGRKKKKDREETDEIEDMEAVDGLHSKDDENQEHSDYSNGLVPDDIPDSMPDLAELGISFDTLQKVDEEETGDASGLDDIFSLAEEENGYDENEELIKQMDRGEIDEEELLEDTKKKKKEKKKKEPKPKKPKKVKEKKPKKVKEKKEDVIIPIPKVFLIFAFSFLVLFIVILIFGGNFTHYNTCVKNATDYYVDKKYSEAYSEISGLEAKKEDEAFFTQLETVMFVMRHYETGRNLVVIGDYENGLDALLKGVKTFDKYQNVGRDFDCYDDMAYVLSWIDIELERVYGLTESDARNLNNIEDREEYAFEVRVIAKNARLNNNSENK